MNTITELPEWVDALTPERRTRMDDGSWLFEWFGGYNPHSLEFYDDGKIVAIGKDFEDPDKKAYCTVFLSDREWVEDFARDGWQMFTNYEYYH